MSKKVYTSWEDAPAILTLPQMAQLLQIHLNTAKNWVASGKVPAVKVGRAWRIDKEDIKALFDGKSIPT